jgi:hypothetical protein
MIETALMTENVREGINPQKIGGDRMKQLPKPENALAQAGAVWARRSLSLDSKKHIAASQQIMGE